MKNVIMSDEYPGFCRELAGFGYHIIPTENVERFHIPERRHADMQVLMLLGRVFTLLDCNNEIGAEYPDNVRLNCLFFGGRLYGKLSAVDTSVLDFCRKNAIECVNVNQGYTRCSTLVVHDHAAITADRSVAGALKAHGAEVLLIAPGHIRLTGFDYGFIGGASFRDADRVFFFGDITKHPDYTKIRAFCEHYHSNIEILGGEEPLTDIGGAVLISSD